MCEILKKNIVYKKSCVTKWRALRTRNRQPLDENSLSRGFSSENVFKDALDTRATLTAKSEIQFEL